MDHPAVLDALQARRADYAAGRVLQPITGFRTGMIGGTEVETRYGQHVSYGIRRCEFDHYLLERIGRAPAPGRTGAFAGATRRRLDRQRRHRDAAADRRRRPFLSGGARAWARSRPAPESVVAAKEIEFAMDASQENACGVRADTPELFFCRDLKGYGWCFRKGRYLNIGLGREDKHHLSEHLDAFCDFLRRRGKIPAGIPERFHGHAYLLHGRGARRLFDDGVLLIGDAAGLAYAESGEGIRPAVESALLAAATLLEAGRDYRQRRLAPYPQRLQNRLGMASPAEGRLPAGLQRFIGGKLLSSAWFTRHVVLDRWFLHASQDALRAG